MRLPSRRLCGGTAAAQAGIDQGHAGDGKRGQQQQGKSRVRRRRRRWRGLGSSGLSPRTAMCPRTATPRPRALDRQAADDKGRPLTSGRERAPARLWRERIRLASPAVQRISFASLSGLADRRPAQPVEIEDGEADSLPKSASLLFFLSESVAMPFTKY
jgi:hypothetical protein